MKNIGRSLILTALFSIFVGAQTSQIPSIVPVDRTTQPKPAANRANGQIYTNGTYGFEITFPYGWQIPENYLKEDVERNGYDIKTKTPAVGSQKANQIIVKDIERVKVLLTAYHSAAIQADRAVLRVSVEDLSALPQINDAVDYFDAMRQSFQTMKLPADFKYSETKAEKLGKKQFAFLDTSTNAGQKRLYATVRGGYAIMFTLTYKKDEDLQAFRSILAAGSFASGQ